MSGVDFRALAANMSLVNTCPRCKKSVYKAEEKTGAGSHWHARCFKCAVCSKGLDSTTLADKAGEIYCKSCYGKAFGPKGYGYGGGAGVLNMDGGSLKLGQKQQQASASESSSAPDGKAAAFCPSCGTRNDSGGNFCPSCGGNVDASASAAAPDASASASESAPTPMSPSESESQSASSSSPTGPSAAVSYNSGRVNVNISTGSSEKCGRCGKSVYHAERAIGGGQVWHKACFKCSECRKGLDSDTLTERDKEIFCKSCYGKKFGPKGFGYGQGAGTLAHTQ